MSQSNSEKHPLLKDVELSILDNEEVLQQLQTNINSGLTEEEA